ncbi:hypothetical protein BC829DRAFT_251041 [Chytridium lagenaria]|nr:hypothetical protein BC829DRAFT_251041 [Chytridium lagenaria]
MHPCCSSSAGMRRQASFRTDQTHAMGRIIIYLATLVLLLPLSAFQAQASSVNLAPPFTPSSSSTSPDFSRPRRATLDNDGSRQSLDLAELTTIAMEFIASKSTSGELWRLSLTDRYQDANGLLHVYICELYQGVRVINRVSSVHIDSLGISCRQVSRACFTAPSLMARVTLLPPLRPSAAHLKP